MDDADNRNSPHGTIGEPVTKRVKPNRKGRLAESTPGQKTSQHRAKQRGDQEGNALISKTDNRISVEAPAIGTADEAEDLRVDEDDVELVDNEEELDVEVEGPVDHEEKLEDKPKELSRKAKKKLQRLAKQMSREAGPVIVTITSDSLTPVSSKVTWNGDPELLCSYNWQSTNDGENTIFVPGGPSKWIPNKALPQTLQADQGFQASDYNYVRKPYDPYSPLFTALGVMNPGYQFWDVDVLADRNNLRILLEFVQGKANGPLRLDAHMVYNTLVLVRKGEAFWKLQDPILSPGIGSNFEKCFTNVDAGMEDAGSHYRAIRYPMGPIQVVVRFEADAYYDESVSDDLSAAEVDAVTGALLKQRPSFNMKLPVRFLQKGHIVPMSQMAELKSAKHKYDFLPSVACQDQLWFGRTTHLFTGFYTIDKATGTGEVVHVKYENAKSRVDNWEERHQESLQKLVDLLTRIRDVLKQQTGPLRAGVLVRETKDSPLVMRTMLRKNHIIGREFFEAHWHRRPVNSRFQNLRGTSNADRARARPFSGASTRGYHTQSSGTQGGNFQHHPGGFMSSNWPGQNYGGRNAQNQPGGVRGDSFQPHYGGYGNSHQSYHGDGGYNTQNQPGNMRGDTFQQHYGGYGNGYQSYNGDGGQNPQYQRDGTRGRRTRGRGSVARGRGRGRGYDANQGRFASDN